MAEATFEWLVEWFARQAQLDAEEVRAMRAQNYFDRGLVDSFGVIEMISELQDHFGIHLTEDLFQDRRFATIDGLGEIIDELREGDNA